MTGFDYRALFRAFFVLATLIGAESRAQAPRVSGFDLERLELDPYATGSLVLGTGELPPPGAFRLSLSGHYELKPLVSRSGDQDLGAVVRDRVTAHLTASYALHERFALGVEIPAVVYQSSDSPAATGFQSPASGGLGKPVVSGRVGVLRDGGVIPFDLALQLGIGLPIGSEDAIAVNRSFSFTPKVLVGKRISRFLASAEINTTLREKVSLNAARDVGSQFGIGASLSAIGERIRGELTYRSAVSFSGLTYAAELLAGGRISVAPEIELFALAGPGFSRAPGSPVFRVLLGAAWGREPAKPPLPAPLFDPCAPGNKHTPEQCPDLDDDGDGIKNKDDKCPLEPGPKNTQGCPDSDGDGVPDYLDKCPHDPGPPENQGCPIAEKPKPPAEPVVATPEKIIIRDKVYFETGKAILRPESSRILDQVAEFMNGHPNLQRVLIEGHTDNTGPMAVNMRLSQARAETVRKYLISKKVKASRMTAKGFGPTRPIDSNETVAGRDRNRRVEFTILSQADSKPSSGVKR